MKEEQDDLDAIKDRLMQDLIVLGTATYKAFTDDDNRLKIQYVDPQEPMPTNTDNGRIENLTIEQVEDMFGNDMADKVREARKEWSLNQSIKYKSILDGAYDGSAFKALNLDEMVLMPPPKDSTAERLKIAKALSSIGSASLDKRIYNKKK